MNKTIIFGLFFAISSLNFCSSNVFTVTNTKYGFNSTKLVIEHTRYEDNKETRKSNSLVEQSFLSELPIVPSTLGSCKDEQSISFIWEKIMVGLNYNSEDVLEEDFIVRVSDMLYEEVGSPSKNNPVVSICVNITDKNKATVMVGTDDPETGKVFEVNF